MCDIHDKDTLSSRFVFIFLFLPSCHLHCSLYFLSLMCSRELNTKLSWLESSSVSFANTHFKVPLRAAHHSYQSRSHTWLPAQTQAHWNFQFLDIWSCLLPALFIPTLHPHFRKRCAGPIIKDSLQTDRIHCCIDLVEREGTKRTE